MAGQEGFEPLQNSRASSRLFYLIMKFISENLVNGQKMCEPNDKDESN
jgi:hypothetical protein